MTTSPIRSKNYFKSSSRNQNISNKNKNYFPYEKIAYQQLILKYYTIPLTYEINIINNIIYNEKSHIVAKFKDYLILDDSSEFLKRYYKKYESEIRLPKFYEYYETYSKIFPNYTGLPEGQYIYKNIQKKQIMIDIQEQMEIENKHNSNKNFKSEEKINEVFSTDVIDSILNQTNKEDVELLFNINIDNLKIEEQKFTQNIIDIIDTIEKYENANNNDHSHINIDNITNSNTFNVKSPLGYNIMKKNKINNSNINNSNNSNNISNIFNKGNNIKNNIFSIYSYKQKSFNQNNANHNINKNNIYTNKTNINNNDKFLIEKLESNLLKLSRKTSLTNLTSINQTKQLNNNSRQHKSNNAYNYAYNNSLKSRSNSNISNSLNTPLSYRICGSSENIKTPITSRNTINRSSGKNKQNNKDHYIKNDNIENNKKINIGKNYNSKITNNIIYIINQNPKFTTNLTFYNNNNNNNNINNNNNNLNNINNNNNNNLNNINNYNNNNNFNNNNTNKHTFIQKKYKSISNPKEYNPNKQKIKKRNNQGSGFMNPSMSNNNILKTAREIGYKEINLLRNTLKNNIRNNINLNSSKNSSINNKFYFRENSFSRNKKHNSIEETNSKISKNDSMTKLGLLDLVNVKKKIVKGIHIKNFSQILNGNSIQTKRKKK